MKNLYPDIISEKVWTKALKSIVQYVFIGIECLEEHKINNTIIMDQSFGMNKDNIRSTTGIVNSRSTRGLELSIQSKDGLTTKDSAFVCKQLSRGRINTSYLVLNNKDIHNMGAIVSDDYGNHKAFLSAIVNSSTGNTYNLSAFYPSGDYICCQGSEHGVCNHAVAILLLFKRLDFDIRLLEEMLIVPRINEE